MGCRLPTVVAMLAAVNLLLVGCTQAAPAPAPTKAPAAPTQVAAPTQAAAPTKAPQPTSAAPTQVAAAPAKKVDFPTRTITLIVPIAAGGTTDVAARMLAAQMEKQLKVSVQVVNKPGASSQTGMTELAQSKPDGYTMAIVSMPTMSMTYIDPDRKAVYGRKDLQPVAVTFVDMNVVAVKSDSPHKTAKDLADAGKANPGKIAIASSGKMSGSHVAGLQFQKAAGAQFALVHFDGGAPGLTALLGGHVSAIVSGSQIVMANVRAGTVRVLAIADRQESKFVPGAPTLESQGFKVYSVMPIVVVVPAGTPKEVVDILDGAVKTSLESSELLQKTTEQGWGPRYMGSAQTAVVWDEMDSELKSLLKELRE